MPKEPGAASARPLHGMAGEASAEMARGSGQGGDPWSRQRPTTTFPLVDANFGGLWRSVVDLETRLDPSFVAFGH
jgi:hypothetical protein